MFKNVDVKDGVITLSQGDYGFQKVLDDFPNSKNIVVVTYNLSKGETDLLDKLKTLGADVSVTIVSNIPQRYEAYLPSKQKIKPEDRAIGNIRDYFQQLDRSEFNCDLDVFFCYKNHSKIILTENIAYIGSANFSDESSDSFEAGVIITDNEAISSIRDTIVQKIIDNSDRYTTSYYTLVSEHVIDWLNQCRDFFEHLDMGIFTIEEVGYCREEKVVDYYNAYLSSEKIEDFKYMLYEAESLIEELIQEFEDHINGENLKRLYNILVKQANQLMNLIEELAEFHGQDQQTEYAQDLWEYSSGEPEEWNYALEYGQNKAQEELERITSAFNGRAGYFERVQNRIPRLLWLIVNYIDSFKDVIRQAAVYENQHRINNTGRSL